MPRVRVSGSALRRARAVSSADLSSLVETLERRALLAAFIVTDPGDSGPGTLRQAILDANVTTGPDTITFNLPGPTSAAVRSIRPLSALPEITGTTTIDGGTRPGTVVELDGSLAGPGANGLTITGSQSVVRALVINRFAGHGVAVVPVILNGRPGPAPTGVRVEGNLIGTDWTGGVAQGNGGAGVFNNNASGTLIGAATPTATDASSRNVISGNGGPGVWVLGTSPNPGPNLFGNYIGTNAAGGRAVPNGREGVLVEGVSRMTVGGNTPATRNVISGNASSGIRVATTSGQVDVRNNYIGTNAAGSGAVPNGWSSALPYHDGVTVQSSGAVFIVGGPSTGAPQPANRNVISGNVGAGVRVEMSQDTQIVGNYIGTDATGFADVGNGGGGVIATPFDTISNAANVARLTGNLISGNNGDGVFFGTGSTVALTFGGNYIGTNAAGTGALGNSGNGVSVVGASIQSIGAPGTVPPPLPGTLLINPAGTTRNVISANGGHGIQVLGGGARVNTNVRAIVNNYIGTDYTGTLPLGNGGSGIYSTGVRTNIGGAGPTSANLGNLISSNGGNGITLVAPPVAQAGTLAVNVILGNRIGTAAPAPNTPPQPPGPGTDTGLGNRGHGIAVFHSAGNRIGDGNAAGTNVIAYNGGSGVLVEGLTGNPNQPSPAATAPTLVTGNSIYGNGGLGIDLSTTGEGEGVTPNDARDADMGPNGLQNFPTITEAVVSTVGSSVQIRFVLMSEPSRSYRVEFFSSPLPDPSGYGEGRTYLGSTSVSADASGTASGTFTAPVTGGTNLYFTATATQMPSNITSEFSPAVRGTPQPPGPPIGPADVEVTQRRVFYDGSAFDGQLAEDKVALLPGQIPSPANITSYTRGINGIELMFFSTTIGTRPSLTADDFEFRTGTAGPSSLWVAAPTPVVTLIPVPGPNTVYELTWSDGGVRNAWLEVTIKASERTGLAAPDVFYFGNLVGETGDSVSQLRVSALDLAGTRTHAGEQAGIDSHYDHNRDGVVNALDVAAVRANLGRSLSTPTAIPVVLPPPDEPTDQAAESIADQVLR